MHDSPARSLVFLAVVTLMLGACVPGSIARAEPGPFHVWMPKTGPGPSPGSAEAFCEAIRGSVAVLSKRVPERVPNPLQYTNGSRPACWTEFEKSLRACTRFVDGPPLDDVQATFVSAVLYAAFLQRGNYSWRAEGIRADSVWWEDEESEKTGLGNIHKERPFKVTESSVLVPMDVTEASVKIVVESPVILVRRPSGWLVSPVRSSIDLRDPLLGLIGAEGPIFDVDSWDIVRASLVRQGMVCSTLSMYRVAILPETRAFMARQLARAQAEACRGSLSEMSCRLQVYAIQHGNEFPASVSSL